MIKRLGAIAITNPHNIPLIWRTITMNYIDFNSEEYLDNNRLTFGVAQILNPIAGSNNIGMCVPLSSSADTKFDSKEWRQVQHTFSTAEMPEPIYLSTSPKLVVINLTPSYLKHKSDGTIIPFDSVLYNQEKQKQENKLKIVSYAWVYFISDDNLSTLNPEPFLLTLSGAAGVNFRMAWLTPKDSKQNGKRTGFIADVEALYSKLVRKSDKPPAAMNSKFHSHCIFHPSFDAERRGVKGASASVTVVKDYVKPTKLEDCLIPPGSDLSSIIEQGRQSVENWKPKALMSSNPSTEPKAYLVDDMPF